MAEQGGGRGPRKGGQGRPSEGGRSRQGRPAPGAGRTGGPAPRSSDRRDDRRDDRREGRRDDRRDDRRPARSDEARSADQQRYDGPPIPEEITGRELDRTVAAQLKSLPDKLALRVARHLVAAGQLIETDPKSAYQHTLAARARAARLAVVREAVGEAAYAAGEYAEALTELRAARRMNGSTAYLAVMADCERALKRPDRALTLLKGAPRDQMPADQRAELVIVEAGARRDRGELEAALRTLELSPLDTNVRAPWVARLRYVYADTLVEAGRREQALEWFHRTEAVDGEGQTDAAARAEALERELSEG